MESNEKKPNADDFRREYTEALTRMVERDPKGYAYSIDEIPQVVTRLLDGLAKGKTEIGLAAKLAARKCGIRPTMKAIRELLGGGS